MSIYNILYTSAMDIFSAVLIVCGLILFEVVSSIDNAIINADVLSSMGERARRFFLTWGIFFAVFVVRGFLPWLIVWATVPQLGFLGSLTATFSNDPSVHAAIAASAPILLMGGGIFLLFLFLHWMLLEEKQYVFHIERRIDRHGVWFYAIVSVILSLVVWYAMRMSPMVGFGAVVGSTTFFIVHGFRLQAEKAEEEMKQSSMSDWSKVFFLEVIDLSFSIDGVLGALAFTLSVPLILIGNGIGAILVRQLTVAHIDRVKKYAFLKNGAMYSIGVLGVVMIAHGFLIHIPEWFAPLATILIVGYFFRKSQKAGVAVP